LDNTIVSTEESLEDLTKQDVGGRLTWVLLRLVQNRFGIYTSSWISWDE